MDSCTEKSEDAALFMPAQIVKLKASVLVSETGIFHENGSVLQY